MSEVLAANIKSWRREAPMFVAFGAQVEDVVPQVLTEVLRLAVAGAVIGTGLALLARRRVAPLLFKAEPTDPVVFGCVVVVLLVAARVARLVPAVRAARLDPSMALRSERGGLVGRRRRAAGVLG